MNPLDRKVETLERKVADLERKLANVTMYQRDFGKNQIFEREVTFKGKVYDASGSVVINS